jgi:hypothetical protein
MAQLMRRHPLVTFFLLVFILTWVVWVPRASGAHLGVVGQAWTWIPAIAALLAAALTGGRGALRELGSRLVRWRVGWQWYVVVILGPAVFSLAPATAHPLQRPGGQCCPWRDLGAVAPPLALDGGKRDVSPTRLAAPPGLDGKVDPLHLGLLAYPRKRSYRHALSRGDQPVPCVAGSGWHRRLGSRSACDGWEVGAGRHRACGSRPASCARPAPRPRNVAANLGDDGPDGWSGPPYYVKRGQERCPTCWLLVEVWRRRALSRTRQRPLFTLRRGRGILRSSHSALCIAPVLCNRSSYVEYGGAEPDVHKTLIIPLGCIYGPSYGVGPPDRGSVGFPREPLGVPGAPEGYYWRT